MKNKDETTFARTSEELVGLIRRRAENFVETRQLLCSEAVLYVLNQGLKGDLPPQTAIRLACAFPNGVGGAGCMCGAFSGALMALGLFVGHQGLNGKAGKKEETHKILNDFLDRSEKGYFSPYMIATVYSGLGEKDKVFEWLDKAYEVQDPWQALMKVDIVFDSLHSDPRWTEALKKRGLAD